MDFTENMHNNSKRIVVKVGTSTLTHHSGRLNLRMMDKIAMVLSHIKNEGKDIILVTSGAVTAGTSTLGFEDRPKTIREKQAAASVGQCRLMYIYDKIFSQYGQIVSQLLLVKGITEDDTLRENFTETLETLLSFNVIPIVNENDSVAIEEIVYGDNDTLSAITAKLVKADLLIILTDIDGLYDDNPQVNKKAKLIPVVEEITEEIESLGGRSGSKVGTGGMATKITAAKIAVNSGIDVIILNGEHPERIYDVLEGKQVGTLFTGKEKLCQTNC